MLLLPSYEGGRVERLAFTPEGDWLVSVALHPRDSQRSAPARMWNRFDGLQLYVPTMPEHHGHCVALSANGAVSAWTGAWQSVMVFWDTLQAMDLHRLRGRPSETHPIALSADGLLAAIMRGQHDCDVLSTSTGALRYTLRVSELERVQTLGFTPDSSALVFVGAERIVVAGLGGGDTRTVVGRFGQVLQSQCSDRGDMLAMRTEASIIVVNIKDGSVCWRLDRNLREPRCNSVAFSPDCRKLGGAFADGSVILWNAATGRPEQTFHWKLGELGAVAFAPDGLTCAAGGDEGRIVIWDLDDD